MGDKIIYRQYQLRRLFDAMFQHALCILGINETSYLETSRYFSVCLNSPRENRIITNQRTLAHLDSEKLNLRAVDNCYPEIGEIEFVARVVAKIVEDVSCKV